MAKYIIEFEKKESAKYVSHLDIVRMFGRTMRRAGVEISFSNGFNPHPIMNFAHPLGVGISSSCELMEMGVEGDISPKELAGKLAKNIPDGFKIVSAKKSEEKSPFSALKFAEYEIVLVGEFGNIPTLLDKKEIITEKKTKSGSKLTDIRPYIRSVEIVDEKENEVKLRAVLKCGEENLKPELFVKVVEETGLGKVEDYKLHRTALLDAEANKLVSFTE